MKNKNILILLANKFELFEIERALFFTYLSNKNIGFKTSVLLKKYFKDFQLDQELKSLIDKLEIKTFTDLEKSQELLIPINDRKINGAFFTPKNIVHKIIEEVEPKINDKCSDISCGCGAFLLGLIRYYKNTFNKPIKLSVKENIFGYDILKYNIRRAQILISIFALEENEILEEDDFNLETVDSLKKEWNSKFEIIVGNPPYVKFQDMNNELRNYLLKQFQTIEKGTYNLYFAFFEKGYQLLSDKGRLGYITPNNYFTSLSGETLRSFFSKNKAIYKIIDFNSTKVFDVLTYTCLTFINKTTNSKIKFNKHFKQPFDSFVQNISSGLSSVNYSDLLDKKWRLLLDDDQANIKKIENIGEKIGSLFTINVGIATLRDDLYYIDGNDDGGHYKIYKNQKFYIDDDLVKSIYKISDFKNQNDCNSNSRKIIFPYIVKSNKSVLIPENILNKKYPKTFIYFEKIKKKLKERTKKKDLNPYYQYGRSQGLNKFGIRLLTPTFSKSPKFLKVTEKNSLYCNGYGLHYNLDQNKNTLFDINPIQDKKNIDLLQKILNSHIMDYYVSKTSVTIDGGFPCYQKNFIELFTIPSLSQEKIDILKKTKKNEFKKEMNKIYDINLEL